MTRELLSAQGQHRACADHYERAIQFLVGRGDLQTARKLAAQAQKALWVGAGFASRPGESRCDAVDGPGILFNALIDLENI